MDDLDVLRIFEAYLKCSELELSGECVGQCVNCPLYYEIGKDGQFLAAIQYVVDSLKLLKR